LRGEAHIGFGGEKREGDRFKNLGVDGRIRLK
jgi:hypothetical protein